MKAIASLIGRHLRWIKPEILAERYELRADEELAATLQFRSVFGSFASGESLDGCWTFKRVGIWQPKVTVRVQGANEDVATFENNTWSGGGTLVFADGRRFRVATNSWQTRLDLQEEEGRVLTSIHYDDLVQRSAKVEIEAGAAGMPELPWMTMLVWYLAKMMQRDSAIVSAS